MYYIWWPAFVLSCLVFSTAVRLSECEHSDVTKPTPQMQMNLLFTHSKLQDQAKKYVDLAPVFYLIVKGRLILPGEDPPHTSLGTQTAAAHRVEDLWSVIEVL